MLRRIAKLLIILAIALQITIAPAAAASLKSNQLKASAW
jgi:hypothetical protein